MITGSRVTGSFRAAHETRNDALKAEGPTKSVFFTKQTMHAKATVDVKVRIHQTYGRGSNGVICFSIGRRYVEQLHETANDIFLFICYFSTNNKGILFSIVPFDSPSKSPSNRCLTLFRSVESSSRFKHWPVLCPVIVEKDGPTLHSIQVTFTKVPLYIRAHTD
jgi:hypothetical protein